MKKKEKKIKLHPSWKIRAMYEQLHYHTYLEGVIDFRDRAIERLSEELEENLRYNAYDNYNKALIDCIELLKTLKNEKK